jgi:acyl-CoA reductase-like NAD-dependent aldehyde dehydrogenase
VDKIAKAFRDFPLAMITWTAAVGLATAMRVIAAPSRAAQTAEE